MFFLHRDYDFNMDRAALKAPGDGRNDGEVYNRTRSALTIDQPAVVVDSCVGWVTNGVNASAVVSTGT